jgi:hypothetical protein
MGILDRITSTISNAISPTEGNIGDGGDDDGISGGDDDGNYDDPSDDPGRDSDRFNPDPGDGGSGGNDPGNGGGIIDIGPDLPGWLSNPEVFIRGVVFGSIFAGIANFVEQIINTISTLLLGSNPTRLAAPAETFGLADVPVAIALDIGNILTFILNNIIGRIGQLLASAIPASPGPFDIVFIALLLVILSRVLGDVVLPGLVVALEAVPVVGGPLSTALGMVIDE